MKKIITSLLILSIIISQFSVNVFADKIDRLDKDELKKTAQYLETLNVSELNNYIAEVKYELENNEMKNYNTSSQDYKSSTLGDPVKAAWLAAAQIAKIEGYPCAAKLVEYSVINIDYNENNDMFSENIVKTDVYEDWIADPDRADSIAFKKYDNADLFYALHKVNISLSGSSSGATITINDVFNFELDGYKY